MGEKKMKINIANTEKTQAELNKIQGRSTKRCYNAKDLQDIADDFARSMKKLGVSRAKLAGCTVDFGGNYEPAKAYKYPFVGTVGTIAFSTNGAFLVALERTYCTRRTGATLAGAAREAVIRNVEKLDY
jgi:hypothetical protein